METGERLSAYLAGELNVDEAAALEAELAGDAALRAQLERIRHANGALTALPGVAPSAAFSTQLRQAVSDEITAQRAAPVVDELAARRLQRGAGAGRNLGMGLAAAAVLVVGAIGISNLLGGNGDDVGDGSLALEMAPTQDAVDPLTAYVRVTDTDYNAETVEALAQREGVVDVPAEVDDTAARDLESSRNGAFGLGSSDQARSGDPNGGGSATGGTATGGSADGGSASEDQSFATGPADAAPGADSPPAAGITGEDVAGATAGVDPFADVRRCLPEIVGTATQAIIPLYAEVAAFEGEPAIIYLVLTREPGARLFNRIEAWVVGRADCFPLLFRQVAR